MMKATGSCDDLWKIKLHGVSVVTAEMGSHASDTE